MPDLPTLAPCPICQQPVGWACFNRGDGWIACCIIGSTFPTTEEGRLAAATQWNTIALSMQFHAGVQELIGPIRLVYGEQDQGLVLESMDFLNVRSYAIRPLTGMQYHGRGAISEHETLVDALLALPTVAIASGKKEANG